MSEEAPRTTIRPDGLSPEVIEGRLLAHRTLLALMLTKVRDAGSADQLMALLDSLSVVQDHQEDPGFDVDGLEVIQGSLAEEIRTIVLESNSRVNRSKER